MRADKFEKTVRVRLITRNYYYIVFFFHFPDWLLTEVYCMTQPSVLIQGTHAPFEFFGGAHCPIHIVFGPIEVKTNENKIMRPF